MNLLASQNWIHRARGALSGLAAASALLAFSSAPALAQTSDGSSGCSAPLKRLQAMSSARPQLAEGHAQLGRCYLALGRSDIAYESFERAAEIEPTPDRQLEVAIALYHARKVDEASAALERLADVIPDRADLHFYRGLILLERGEQAAAAARLDHARRLAPGRVEPTASYFAGVAYANAGDRARADEALRRVSRDWEGTQWGDAAEAELARLRGTNEWHYWLDAEAGLAYDSNVSLIGRSVTPEEISDKDDFLTGHLFRGGVEASGPDWYAGLSAAYQGSIHFSQNQFDLKYPSLTAYGFHRIGASNGIRVQLSGGRAWVGNDPFVVTYDSTVALNHDWSGAYGSTELFSDFLFRNYQRSNFDVPGPGGGVNSGVCPPPTSTTPGGQCGPANFDEKARRDRDGIGFRAGIAHRLPFRGLLRQFRIATAYERYIAEGSEYDYDSFELGVRGEFDIAFGLTGELQSTYRALWYEHRSTYPDAFPTPDTSTTPTTYFPYTLSNDPRRENVLGVSAAIERELLYDLAVSLRFNYEQRFSNTQVFSYSRYYTGVYVSWRPTFEN